MAAGDKSPGHVISDAGNLHPAGLSTGRGSLQYQGTDYTILDESIPEHAFYLAQGNPLLELVSFPEALQLALSHRFGDFASLRFDSAGQPQVAFRSVCSVQPCMQPARAPPCSVCTGGSCPKPSWSPLCGAL